MVALSFTDDDKRLIERRYARRIGGFDHMHIAVSKLFRRCGRRERSPLASVMAIASVNPESRIAGAVA
jgi:hypothetical protein